MSWQRQWRAAVGAPEPEREEGPRRRLLILAYRAGGGFFVLIGLGLLGAAAAGLVPIPTRVFGRETLYGGIFFTACGAFLAGNSWLRGGRRAPRFLDGELLDYSAPLPPGERVAAACSRGIISLFLVFGLRLLREGLR